MFLRMGHAPATGRAFALTGAPASPDNARFAQRDWNLPMSDPQPTSDPQVDLELARRVLQAEGQGIAALADRLDESFVQAARAIFACPGQVVATGMGKAGLIAQKISATLASTGTRSIFLHPADALHGDLGRVQRDDVVLALSHSGETDEIVRLLDHIRGRGARLIALTGCHDSPLARDADICVCYGQVEEACPLGLAPTVSTSCMLALGDALALVVMQMRRFEPQDYAAFHPGGALGRRLMTVEQAALFRLGDRLTLIGDHLSMREALVEAEKVERRSGAMVLVDGEGKLSGILTDADLRRQLVRRGRENLLDLPVREVMTARPKHVRLGQLVSDALAIMNRYRIDELPVVDQDDRPVGIIDSQDLLGIKALGNGD
jgi:arabinose-5-phosphate isomerase